MSEIRTYATEMQINAGAVADFDLEVDGYYDAAEPLNPISARAPPEQSSYLIFRLRARNLMSQPVADSMGNATSRGRISGKWVELPIALFTPDQIRRLELRAAGAFEDAGE